MQVVIDKQRQAGEVRRKVGVRRREVEHERAGRHRADELGGRRGEQWLRCVVDAKVGKDGVGQFLAGARKGVAPKALGQGAKGQRGVVGKAVECVKFAVPEEGVGKSGCDGQWAEAGRGDGEGGVGVER